MTSDLPPPAGDPVWLSEARYRAIVEDQPDLVCRFRPDGTLTFANQAYCAFFGIRREEVVGQRYHPIVHPDDLPHVEAQVALLSPAHPVVSIVNRVIRADGSVRWTEWSNRALYDTTGLLLEFQSTGRDITDRKQAQEKTAQLAAIVSSADLAIYSTTLDGIITSWNRAAERMFGYTAREVIGRSIAIIIPPNSAAEGLNIPARVRAGETIEHIETEKVDKSGQRIPISLTVSPIVDDAGHVIGISRIARDITERKRVERELQERRAAAEEASRLKDEFLAVVSHELRTPVNAMLGWAQLLRAGMLGADAVPKALETIERNARIQAQLIEDLLDVSRIVSGHFSLRSEPVDLAQVVRAAVDAVQPTAAAKGVDLRLHAEDTSLATAGDGARLQQAVWNLLINALKFTARGGHVTVRLHRIDGQATITVQDSGVGIPADALPFIFDRFRQADSRTTRAHGGLGLGLTIVEHVARAHGGTVRARSEGVGRGATFEITLPIIAEIAVKDSGTRNTEQPNLTGRHIVVVDDEPDARELAQAILEQCGATVVTAASASEAIERIQAARPDVLLADIGMPEQDGYDLIRLVRAMNDLPSLLAVALTAYAGPQHRSAALAAGYDEHLKKPVDPSTLCSTIANLLDGRAQPT